jgi:hypothetical protein
VRVNTAPRNIASGVRAPGFGAGLLSNGTDTTQNMRSAHFNESGAATTELALIYPGWYLDTNNETNVPNSYTVAASIEYPAGTYTQVKWSASATRVVTAGTNTLSDYVAIAIPAGAQFWVRTFISVTGGQVWPLSGVGGTTIAALGEECEVGVGLANKTMSGTITGTATGYRPSAIVGKYVAGMKNVSLAGLGDSILSGLSGSIYDSKGNTSWPGYAASGKCPYIPISVSGTTAASQAAANKMDLRKAFLQAAGITHVVTEWGTNDLQGGSTSAQVIGNLQTIWGHISGLGMKVIQSTITPRSTSTKGHYDVASQTAVSGFAGAGSHCGVTNAFIRGNPSPLYDYIEVSNLVSSAVDSGIWATGDSLGTARALQSEVVTLSGTPTTTSFVTNSAKANDYYFFGAVEFLTGGLAGQIFYWQQSPTSYSVNNVGGTISVSPALPSAPASGNTARLYPLQEKITDDGVHPYIVQNFSTGLQYGGHLIIADSFGTKLTGWL